MGRKKGGHKTAEQKAMEITEKAEREGKIPEAEEIATEKEIKEAEEVAEEIEAR